MIDVEKGRWTNRDGTLIIEAVISSLTEGKSGKGSEFERLVDRKIDVDKDR